MLDAIKVQATITVQGGEITAVRLESYEQEGITHRLASREAIASKVRYAARSIWAAVRAARRLTGGRS